MQQSLSEFVAAMDEAGILVRIKGEVRVDQIPKLMEANPTKAVLIEKVKDTGFSVLANACSNQEMFAWAMGCDKTRTGLEMVARSKGLVKWEAVTTAPCKEVILNGDDVDLTRLPLFLHRDRDGHAYTNDPSWYRHTLSATPFSWEAKPQPVNHADPRHITTAG